MTPPFTLRRGTADDGPALVALVRALADYEKLAGPDDAAAARLQSDIGRHFELWVAEVDAEVVGYAIFFVTYSTFRALPSLKSLCNAKK